MAMPSASMPQRRDEEEHAAPADKVGDDARQRRAEHVAGDDPGQPAADRDLPVLHRDQIADHRDADREDAARRDAGDDPRAEQNREVGRKPADQQRDDRDREARDHDAHLADHVADRAEHRLHQRERQCERGRQQRHGVGVDLNVMGDRRDDRVGHARGERRDEADQGEFQDQDVRLARVRLRVEVARSTTSWNRIWAENSCVSG